MATKRNSYKLALKSQNSFATLMFKKQNDPEYGFPQLLEFCKKVFKKQSIHDTIIYSPYFEHENELGNYITDSAENRKEFEKVFEDCLNFNLPTADQIAIYNAYSIGPSKIDLFIQVVFYSLRKIDEKHDVNLLLNEKISLIYSK